MSNYIDCCYNVKSEPTKVFVWEQNYETNEVEVKEYNVADYLYFYVDALDESKAETEFTSQRGTKVQKVVAENYKALRNGEAVKFYHSMKCNTYESDIEPIHKVMLDNYGKDNQKAAKWNLALYDIEVDALTEDSFMDVRANAHREINSISIWYSKPNKFFNFAVVPPALRDDWNYDEMEIRGNFHIVYFSNEKEMLEAFFEVTKEYDTIALGAWNGDFFDTKYVFDRCRKLWNEKDSAIRMGRFGRINKTKLMRGEVEEVLIRPIGMIWYDCLEAYKKNGPELESFALSAVAEEEGLGNKVEFGDTIDGVEEIANYQKRIKYLEKLLAADDFDDESEKLEVEAETNRLKATIDVITTRPKNFEELYHGRRVDRERLIELTPSKKRKVLMDRAKETFGYLVEELYELTKSELEGKGIPDHEFETRIQQRITEKIEILFRTDEEFLKLSEEQRNDLERFFLHKKLLDTYRLFLDYSNQDSQILHDLELKLDKFKTLMMLAQYNVSGFYDVFSTVKQVEQGITNFAHINNKKVVIDREYNKAKQIYNQFVDPEIMRIREDNDYKINPEDNERTREIKSLISQTKIPGANVMLPNTGLISFSETETPPLAREYKRLRAELKEVEKQIAELEREN